MAKLTIEFSDEASDILEMLAMSQGTTYFEILRKAVSLEKWFHETVSDGGKVFVRYADGREAEVGKR